MAGQGIGLDTGVIHMVRAGEDTGRLLARFGADVEGRAATWPPGDREEMAGCLWNKLFCAAVQYTHEELADKLVTEPAFKTWVKIWSQVSQIYGPCPLTTSVHYENLELAKCLMDMGMDVHREAPMMFLVPVPSAGGATNGGGGSRGADAGGDLDEDMEVEIAGCGEGEEEAGGYVYEETRCCTAMDPTPLGRGGDSVHPPLLSENTWASLS